MLIFLWFLCVLIAAMQWYEKQERFYRDGMVSSEVVLEFDMVRGKSSSEISTSAKVVIMQAKKAVCFLLQKENHKTSIVVISMRSQREFPPTLRTSFLKII